LFTHILGVKRCDKLRENRRINLRAIYISMRMEQMDLEGCKNDLKRSSFYVDFQFQLEHYTIYNFISELSKFPHDIPSGFH
jgi:hypothetical protein